MDIDIALGKLVKGDGGWHDRVDEGPRGEPQGVSRRDRHGLLSDDLDGSHRLLGVLAADLRPGGREPLPQLRPVPA